MTNKSCLKISLFFISFFWVLFREMQLMIHDFKTLTPRPPAPAPLSLLHLQHENIWHILVLLLLLGFWSYFGRGKWIHLDRQNPWSSPPSPSCSLTPNSCQWFPAGRGPGLFSWERRSAQLAPGSYLHTVQEHCSTPPPPHSPDPTPAYLF